MYLTKFQLQDIRNLSTNILSLEKQLNIFYGENGAGKSSVLEGISILTSGRSFRTSKLDLVVKEDSDAFVVFGAGSDQTKLGVGYSKSKKQKSIKINGENISTLSSLSRIYPTQVLSPESYHLIDAGPQERRKYLDWCLFHVEHSYHETWKNYQSTLKQRNALLRTKNKSKISQQITFWDQQLCLFESVVTKQRSAMLELLLTELLKVIQDLGVKFFDGFKISYYPGYTGEYEKKLADSFHADCECGLTRFGPHKADIKIKVQGYPAKEFFSRGQKKVAINAMFLAQTVVLKNRTGKDSLFIIDDFTSELDESNQKELLQMLLQQKNVQIILSCLQLDSLKWLKKRYNSTQLFHVEHGVIKPVSTSEIDEIDRN